VQQVDVELGQNFVGRAFAEGHGDKIKFGYVIVVGLHVETRKSCKITKNKNRTHQKTR
jgi:hypothetical protein